VTEAFNPHLDVASNVHALVSAVAPSWLSVEPSDGYAVFSAHCELPREKDALSWFRSGFLRVVEPRLFRLRETFPVLKSRAVLGAANIEVTRTKPPSPPPRSGIRLIKPTTSIGYIASVVARTYRLHPDDVRVYHPEITRRMEVIALEVRRAVLTHDQQAAPTQSERATIEFELAQIAAALSERKDQIGDEQSAEPVGNHSESKNHIEHA